MDIKATRHTSTNLEELTERIERILKDASQLENDKSIDLNTLTLPELKAFAEQGGLGACVSKTDVLAETSEDLMYLSGIRKKKLIYKNYINLPYSPPFFVYV
ncbi:hypothetical protein BC941DRAFT_168049 [Chlamydoabsidia padenii]|nr:hypothetical protein BC941DRAFT_168049 [Chlamydoabsidia padenii]